MAKIPPQEEILQRSMKELSSVLSTETYADSIIREDDPLLKACEILGKRLGIAFTSSRKSPQNISDICEASNVRYRELFLEKDWWRESQGSLLGFYSETNQPIVLIDEGSHYVLIDPLNGQKKRIDAKESQKIKSLAYHFYTSLPEPFGRIIPFLFRGNFHDYFVLISVSLLMTLMGFAFPFANKILFDVVIPQYNINLYIQIVLGLVIAVISASIFFLTRSFTLLRLEAILGNRLQMGLWDRLLRLPVNFFQRFASGDLIQRTLLIDQIRRALNANTLRIILNGFFSIFYIIIMLVYSWQLTILVSSLILVACFFSFILSIFKYFCDRNLIASNAKINAFLTQVIRGITKLRSAAAESHVFFHWAQEFSTNQKLSFQSRSFENGVKTINSVVNLLTPLIIFVYIILLMKQSTSGELPFTIGTFLAFYAALTPFTIAFTDLINTLVSLISLIPFWERSKVILDTPLESKFDQPILDDLKGKIKVDQLFFRYDKSSRFVLENISFEVNPGEFIGIIGPSGCGKSSLCRLLIGFEKPETGMITYDEHDLSRLNHEKLRMQMGILLQNSSLFFGTIYDNITCGQKYAEEEIQKAMQLSTFNQDIIQFPMGLATILPSGGGILSGGQKQRLLLTRILIKKPKILILDEATNELDKTSQNLVMQNLINQKMTKIVISHQFEILRNADRIYSLEKGILTLMQ